MDDLVLRGMAKWPNVPAVYGWLTLDRRGQWLIKGELVSSPVIAEFIGRNYEADADGRWFFQNGPQRVFVTLDYTPYVFRAVNATGATLEIVSHNGVRPETLRGAWIDDGGAILLETDTTVGLVHDRDLDAIVASFVDETGRPVPESVLDESMERLQRGEEARLRIEYRDTRIDVRSIRTSDVPRRFGFDPQPTAPAGHPECT